MSWYLYLLENTDNKKTYLGVTTDYKRRIRQHNGEIKGGAKYTHSFKGSGEWKLVYLLDNLSKNQALSYERSIKNRRKKAKGKTPLEKRMYAINDLFSNL